MKRLYEAANQIEAQMLKDQLLAQGIESVILGGFLSGAAGELPANIYPEVWVLDEGQLPQARELLAEFAKNQIKSAQTEPWDCPNCGARVDAGFDLCWNCALPRKTAKTKGD